MKHGHSYQEEQLTKHRINLAIKKISQFQPHDEEMALST